MKKSLGIFEARRNGHRGIINNQWLMTAILTAAFGIIGFFSVESFHTIKGILIELNQRVNTTCISIETLRVRVAHLEDGQKEVKAVLKQKGINSGRIIPTP